MKKTLVIVVAVLAYLAIAVGLWHFFRAGHGASRAAPELRAMMRDEDAPRPIEPSIALQVNEDAAATVFAGAPVWLTVGVDNAAAADEIAAARVLSERLTRLPANDPGRERLRAARDRRAAPANITLGDAAHPWTAAIQFVARDGQGERPLAWLLQPLGSPDGVVQLDAAASARANFGAASTQGSPGAYSIVACLGATGTWRGRVCSEPVQLTVLERPARLTPEQQAALNRQGARFALLAGDAVALEYYGRKLVAADPDSIDGRMYLGEASYRQAKWEQALQEFAAARSSFDRRHPDALERPRFLVARINQLMEKLSHGP
jgi:hypothetical protein